MLRARVWLLLLLGVSFLASVCVSFGVTQQEQQCLQICESEKDPYQLQICKNRCKVGEEREREEERGHDDRGRRERGRQEGEKEEEKRDERVHPRPHPPHQHEHDQEEEHVWPHQEDERQRGKESEANEKREEELWRGRHRWEDPEERERVRQRVEERIKREMEERMKREEEEKRHRREKRERREEREKRQDSQTHKKNPFYFSSKMFTTLYKNQYGHIRVLHSFHKRSPKLKNLVNYRIVQFQSKPNTLLLPGHADVDSIIIILSGRALVTFFNPNNRETYSLEPGYAQRIPPGTTFTVANLDKNNDLKLIKLAIPVNEPGNYENFFLSSTQDQQSYLQGFSQNILQASFNTDYDEIKRVLFGEEGQHNGEQSKQEGVIVELSKEQIQELSKPAKRKIISVEYEPFYLRSPYPIYSNNFGKFFEVIPDNNPHLKDLDIYLDSVDMNEGALLLPHFNSKAIVILAVNEGKANIELVGLKEQHEQQEEQETREVQRYEAEVSEDEIFVIPSAYPVVVNATSNLSFFAFGINAENNQRNFLAGEKGNLIREMHRPVKDLAFPGSAGAVQKLMKNQQDSYFVDAQPQPQQKEEEGRKGSPLSSILGALY